MSEMSEIFPVSRKKSEELLTLKKSRKMTPGKFLAQQGNTLRI